MITKPVDVMSPDFLRLLHIYDSQLKQDAANQKAHDEFLQTASNWKLLAQGQLDHGLPVPLAPLPPLMTLMNDDGSISHPSFPDLVIPTLDPVNRVPSTPLFGGPVAMDRTDLLLAQMQVVNSKLDLIARLMPRAS